MKNYLDIKRELEILKVHRKLLLDKKSNLYEMCLPSATSLDNIGSRGSGNGTESKLTTMIDKSIKLKIDEELKDINNKISSYETALKKIERYIHEMNDISYKIFECIYIKGMSVENTAIRLNYSKESIYKKIAIIEENLWNNE